MQTVLFDKLLAESPTVAEHLSSLQLARKAFTMAELSEKTRRALRKQTRQTGTVYTTGDEVYYKKVITISGKVQLKLLGKMVLLFLFVMVGNL